MIKDILIGLIVILIILMCLLSIVHRVLSDFSWYRQWVGGRWYLVRSIFNRKNLRWVLYPDFIENMGNEEVVEEEDNGCRFTWRER